MERFKEVRQSWRPLEVIGSKRRDLDPLSTRSRSRSEVYTRTRPWCVGIRTNNSEIICWNIDCHGLVFHRHHTMSLSPDGSSSRIIKIYADMMQRKKSHRESPHMEENCLSRSVNLFHYCLARSPTDEYVFSFSIPLDQIVYFIIENIDTVSFQECWWMTQPPTLNWCAISHSM